DAYMSRGLAYHKSGDFSKALNDLSHSIEKGDSINIEAYYNRGVVFQDMKNYIEAVKDYETCLELNGEYSNAYYNLGIIFLEQGKAEKAICMFDKSLSSNPKDVLSYTNRGYAKYKLKRYKDAIKDFEYSLKLDSSNYYSLKWIGFCYLQLNEPSISNEYLKRAKKHGVDIEDKDNEVFIKD
ncbi:MAG: tetratricopeptide repeat protein, partial [Chlorobi bacterium]|nr:tetratricopeptide repeat protein [Chlorobiota bacterium]